MKAKPVMIALGLLAIVTIMIIACWLAGAKGLLIGLIVAIAVGLRFASYLGLFTIPPAARSITNFVITVGLVLILVIWIADLRDKDQAERKAKQVKLQAQSATVSQVYANYQFPEGAVQIDVQLIPEKQLLSREAGGWMITPAGSSFRIDHDVPITIEYIDGRKFYRQPGKPADDGVRLSNGVFRLYKVGGGSGIAKVTIKRNVF